MRRNLKNENINLLFTRIQNESFVKSYHDRRRVQISDADADIQVYIDILQFLTYSHFLTDDPSQVL